MTGLTVALVALVYVLLLFAVAHHYDQRALFSRQSGSRPVAYALALGIYWWIIIGSAIFSWLYAFKVVNPRNQFVGTVGDFLFRATEPALRPIRRVLPDLGGIDVSPIVLLLVIFFLRQFLYTSVMPALV